MLLVTDDEVRRQNVEQLLSGKDLEILHFTTGVEVLGAVRRQYVDAIIIDLRLPENFRPQDAIELLHRLAELGNQAIVYAVSFYVLSLHWIGIVRLAQPGETVSESYTRLALTHLFLITCVPFATMVVGRYTEFAPAIWRYAANMILLAMTALRMVALSVTHPAEKQADRIGLLPLIAAVAVTVVLSFVAPKWALLGYLLNLADGPLRRIITRHSRQAQA